MSGTSSRPSRCSSVLLPEPDWPTIDRNSPFWTRDVDAAQHRDLVLPLAIRLLERLRGEIRRGMPVSCMGDRSSECGRWHREASGCSCEWNSTVQLRAAIARRSTRSSTRTAVPAPDAAPPRGAPAECWPARRSTTAPNATQHDHRRLHVRRNLVEVIDRSRRTPCGPVSHEITRFDLVDVMHEQQPDADADAAADEPQRQSVGEEDRHHAPRAGAERLEDADVARLLDDDHVEDRQDAEAGHGDDQEQQHVQNRRLDFDRLQQRPLLLLPGAAPGIGGTADRATSAAVRRPSRPSSDPSA